MACDPVDRSPGRRPIDTAHLVRWAPFLSLLVLIGIQTVYVTRYVAGLEASNATLVTTVSEIRAELKALSGNVNSGAIPSAQTQWRLEVIERAVNDLRTMATDNARRVAAIELQGRAGRER